MRGSRFIASGPTLLDVECPLAGEHQVQNALTAIAAMHTLGIPAAAIQKGIRNVSWPGRMEFVSTGPDVILDGAHNPAGARALAAYIRQFCINRTVWMVYGTMRDKAVTEIGGILFPHVDHLILTAPANSRALRPEALRDLIDHPSVRVAPDLSQALELLRDASTRDIVFISGSLYLVGEARALFVK
jgi:dihydrofolate synthase/folylpolyglutamate synthase